MNKSQYTRADYDQKGNKNYNQALGPTLHDENTHHKHHIDMFKSYLGLTSGTSTVKVKLAILGGGKGCCLVILAEDDNKK